MANDPMKLAALISGGGRTVLNLQEHINAGRLNARIEMVISSRPDAKGVERTRQAGLQTTVIDRKTLSDDAFQRRITEAVSDVGLVCMAGFLSLWQIPEAFRNRVMNIHPALLPEFGGRGMYGKRVHEAVLAAGKIISGCTVHFCDNEYDHGPIILQREVPVHPDDSVDSLAARVFEQECIAYPEAIRRFINAEIKPGDERD